MFSHLNNLLVVFMARYRCKGCMSIIGVDEKAAFYIRLYRVIGYPATIKRSMWQGKTTDRMDCLLSQQGCALFAPNFSLKVINQCRTLFVDRPPCLKKSVLPMLRHWHTGLPIPYWRIHFHSMGTAAGKRDWSSADCRDSGYSR